jgi:hypothetical protein
MCIGIVHFIIGLRQSELTSAADKEYAGVRTTVIVTGKIVLLHYMPFLEGMQLQ